MRVLGVDFGQRRIGLALSDASATLARPWKTVAAGATPRESAQLIASMLQELRSGAGADEIDGLSAIVVGLPKRLNGEETDQTQPAREFAATLEIASGLAVRLMDERLTSHEADLLLGVRERDWRRRKARLDAAAAAVILQEYLDDRRQREARL
jgi:putative holliday junction resolvase